MSTTSTIGFGHDTVITAPALPLATRLLRRLGRMTHAMSVRRQRNALLALDDRMLSDIGIGRAEAYREASRAVYDLPDERPVQRRRA